MLKFEVLIAFAAILLSVVLLALFTVIGNLAFAQPAPLPSCSNNLGWDSEHMHEALTERYGEQMVSFGMISGRTMMRLYAHPNGQTWTITITASNAAMPSGLWTCALAAGQHYRPARIERGDQS